jgi:hypothetical protein
VGHDSNIYSNASEEDGMVYKDALSMSLSASSARTTGQIFYKPTVTVSPEKDVGDVEVYQDFVGLLSHEVSERNILRLKETFTFSEDEDIQTTGAIDNSFWKSATMLGLDRTMTSGARLSLSGTGTVKRYSDAGESDKDYDLFSVGATYAKDLSESTFGTATLSYSVQDYDRSTVDGSSVVFAGAGLNHKLNPDVTLEATAGAQFVEPDGSDADNKVVPYFNGVATYAFSPKTTLSGMVKYYFNEDSTVAGSVGAESLRYELGLRHGLTEKITLTAKAGRTENTYSSDFSGGVAETESDYTDFSTRVSYQINRMHAVDAGYTFRDSETATADFDRQQVDIGWQVKF